jgi:hypothetical protein
MPVQFEDSAEFCWVNKPVAESKLFDDMSDAKTWQIQGQAKGTFQPRLRSTCRLFASRCRCSAASRRRLATPYRL